MCQGEYPVQLGGAVVAAVDLPVFERLRSDGARLFGIAQRQPGFAQVAMRRQPRVEIARDPCRVEVGQSDALFAFALRGFVVATYAMKARFCVQ